MEAACRSRRRKTRHLGLSCDLHLQTGRALLSLRPRLGPAVSHLLSQIRYRDVPDWRYPQPRVSPVFPGHTCRSIPTDICLRSQTHEKTRWVLDEASSSLSMHSATEVSLLSHAVRNLHFLSKISTLISREKLSNCFGWKTRENAAVLDFLAVDNFDFTRKIVKKKLGEKLVKMLIWAF